MANIKKSAIIGRWGQNLAVRFNQMGIEFTGIKEKDKVEVEYHKDKIVIKKVK